MKTLAIISGKGGSGKTTLALHLAVAAERLALRVALLDIDPQSSAAIWADAREGESPSVTSLTPNRLRKVLGVAAEAGAALAIIDSAPHSDSAAIAAAEAADLVLVPCRPGILDLTAIGATARILKLSGKPAFVVLNAVPPHAPRLIDDAREAVKAHGLAVAPVTIAQRAAFAHSLTAGQTAQEFEPSGKASEEISALFAWLRKELAL
jgi:chromosome partitioning protein